MTATVQHLLSKEKHFDDDGDILAKMFQLGALLPPSGIISRLFIGEKKCFRSRRRQSSLGENASVLCGVDQVRSLTQLYSVDFSKSKIDVKKCVLNKCTIKVCVSCWWRCPGTFTPSAAHLTLSLYLCRSGSNARGESRALEGRRHSGQNS